MVKKIPVRKLLAAIVTAAGTLGAVTVAQTSAASVGVYVQVPPPVARVEFIPGPRVGYVWAPGYWEWRGHRHVWIGGTWVRARHGYHYRPHRWVERQGGWYLDRARWDRDGDGIPDRFDRHPNNPNLP